MKHTAILYFATLIVMAALDFLWLGVIAREFYKSRLGSMLEFSITPALVFYVLYILGVVVFVNSRSDMTWQSVMLYGALFGLVAYGTYDLTNLATLRGWPLSVTLVDMAWGTLDTAVAATSGWLIAKYFE